ncbi:hypothetical protein [Streptomyces lydicus]|uniref:hypothetical protein n=1 Tax=Streptomyces lydicus TaxID=47763 RepID=UPI001011FDBE|nr:hypothetical protein [Streptomyces lydicus]MCZ1012643.1 hypothetical protein [Streptomyces lydicus]
MYRLTYDPGIEAVQDSLPPAASEPLMLALADACDAPLLATQPWGQADDRNRMIEVAGVRALLFISYSQKTIAVLAIDPIA